MTQSGQFRDLHLHRECTFIRANDWCTKLAYRYLHDFMVNKWTIKDSGDWNPQIDLRNGIKADLKATNTTLKMNHKKCRIVFNFKFLQLQRNFNYTAKDTNRGEIFK